MPPDDRDGRGEEAVASVSSLEPDTGGVTAIMVAAAKRAIATTIFKHVDIEVAAPQICSTSNVGSHTRAKRSDR
jgi:hypothetical protein